MLTRAASALALIGLLITSTPAPGFGQSKTAPRKFKLVSHTCESGCSDTYETSDGQQVTLLWACYTGTAKEAQAEVQRLINEGNVLQQGWRRYGRGRRSKLARRTVVTYARDESGEQPAKILLHERGDICFWSIEAGWLELALEFERSRAGLNALLRD